MFYLKSHPEARLNLLNLMYSQYCIEDLLLISRIEPRMDMMQMPSSIIDKAATILVRQSRRNLIKKSFLFRVDTRFSGET